MKLRWHPGVLVLLLPNTQCCSALLQPCSPRLSTLDGK